MESKQEFLKGLQEINPSYDIELIEKAYDLKIWIQMFFYVNCHRQIRSFLLNPEFLPYCILPVYYPDRLWLFLYIAFRLDSKFPGTSLEIFFSDMLYEG